MDRPMDTVNSIVTDILQWPHRIVVPLGGIPIDTSERELKPQGKLALTVVKATTLKYMEMIGKSDPNVVVHIQPLFKYKTNVLDNNLNPFWNEKFELIAEDKETQSLILEVSLLILCLLFMLLSSTSFCGICCDIFFFINMCPSIMLITF